MLNKIACDSVYSMSKLHSLSIFISFGDDAMFLGLSAGPILTVKHFEKQILIVKGILH